MSTGGAATHTAAETSGGWRTTWPALLSGPRADAVVAAGLTVVTQVELLLTDGVEGPYVVQALAFAAMTAAVAGRRSGPLLASALAGAGITVQTLTGSAEVVGGFLALIVVAYSVASYAPLRRALLGGAILLAGVFTYPLVNDLTLADEVGNAAIFVGFWAMGRAVRSRQQQAVRTQERLDLVEREQAERLDRIVADERSRIARELHDVVAHGVSLMVLQNGAARQTLDRDPDRVRELLLGAEQQGRQALEEMQRLLGVLRGTDQRPDNATPVGLDAVSGLVDDVRRTGLAVDHRVTGEPRPLPAGLELSGYRIVQEALTNVVRHSGAARAEVVVHYADDHLEVTVTDGGRGGEGARWGHGLVGMGERAALFGGHVEAGPVGRGGWRVRAVLPVGGRP